MKSISETKRYFEGIIELSNKLKPSRSRYGIAFNIEGVGIFLVKIC